MEKVRTTAPQGLGVRGDWCFYFDDGTCVVEKNIVTQAGLEFIASLIVGEQTSDVPLFLAMGTGVTPATLYDTKLVNEGIRKIVSTKQRQGNMIRLRAFFMASEANADWKEFGVFISGTQVKDSGTLLNRLVVPISKASNQVLSVECRITITSV